MILGAAEQAGGGDAILLGPGRCQEVPLAELCERFNHVTMIEMDRPALDEAIATLDGAAKAKIDAREQDLTGVTDSFDQKLGRIVDEADDFGSALPTMVQLLQSQQPGYPPVDQQYDLVVASVLLSQLHVAISNRTFERVAAKWPDRVQSLRELREWTDAMLQLTRKIEPAFVDYVQNLACEGGRIFLSATTNVCYIHAADTGEWFTDGRYRMTTHLRMVDYLDDHSVVESTGDWFWVVAEPVAGRSVGTVFVVDAAVLRRA